MGIEDLSELRRVASGGFATVYAAWDAGFERWVAVKVLPPLDADGQRRFDRERALMAKLEAHPNVVTPYRSGYTDAGEAYLVMEYLDGGSLQDLLHQRGSLRLDRAVDYVLPIVDAVGAGHDLGILHRDIKPANILLSTNDVPKLTDFGISATQDGTTTQAAFTLAHAPPESFADGFDHGDERADLYSLVSTFYTLIRDRTPFQIGARDSASAHLIRIMSHEPGPIGRPDVDAFFAKGLAKDPDDRYQNTHELGSAIEVLSTGRRRGARSAVATIDVPYSAGPTALLVAPAPAAHEATADASSAWRPADETDQTDRLGGSNSSGPGLVASPTPPRPAPGRPANAAENDQSALLRVGLPVAAVGLAFVGLAFVASILFLTRSAPSELVPDVEFDTTAVAFPPTPAPLQAPPTTPPGPGSFSTGLLRSALLTADDLPATWSAEPASNSVPMTSMSLACDELGSWASDSSSDAVIARFSDGELGAGGTSAVEHTVLAFDVWVAESLFEQAASAAECPTWTSTTGEGSIGQRAGAQVVIVEPPDVAGRGHETVTYAVTVAGSEDHDEQQIVYVLTRCSGLVSRLVVSSPQDATAESAFVDQLAATAYAHMIDTAEWENAACPR